MNPYIVETWSSDSVRSGLRGGNRPEVRLGTKSSGLKKNKENRKKNVKDKVTW